MNLADPQKIHEVYAKAFEGQVYAKAVTRGLEMPFLGKNPIGHRFCYFSVASGRSKWDLNRLVLT